METVSVTDDVAGTLPPPPQPTKAMLEWARCRHYIERSIAEGHGFNTIADVEREIEAGRQIFWAHAKGAAITRIDQYDGFRVLTVTYGSGDLSDAEMIAVFMPDLENFARIADCSHVAVEARPERAAILVDAGFAPLTFTFAKSVIPAEALPVFTELRPPKAPTYGRGTYGRGAYGSVPSPKQETKETT